MKYIKFVVLFLCSFSICFSQNCPFEAPRDIRQLDVSYFQLPFGAVVIKGEYGIWYKLNSINLDGTTNPNANRVTKPFIICEGFDPGGNNTLPCIYESIDNSITVNFLRHLRSEGFDIIILNLLTNGIEIHTSKTYTT